MYPTYAPVSDPTAVVGRRIGAWIIDAAIGAIIFFGILLSTAETRSFTSAARAEAECDRINEFSDLACIPADTEIFVWEGAEIALTFLVTGGFWFLNDAVLTGIAGFSIGKGLVGLRVVRQRDGHLAGFGRALGRWALWLVDWFPYCIPIVGLITGLTTKGHRRVGDMVAGTFVVDKHQVGQAPVVIGVTAPAPGVGALGYGPWSAPGGSPGWGAPAPQPSPWNTPPVPGWGAPTPPSSPTPGWGQPVPTGAPGTPPWGPPPGVAWNPPPSDAPWAPPPGGWGGPPTPPSPWTAPPASPTPWSPPADPSDWEPPASPPFAPAPAEPTTVQPVIQPAPSDPTGSGDLVGDLSPTRPLPVAGTPGVDAPLWDDARDAYIQWDPEITRWVQWDEFTQEWRPI